MITAGKKYFNLEGEKFFVIGHNEGISILDRPRADLDKYFKRMRDYHGNVVRILLDNPKWVEPRINDYTRFEPVFTKICESATEHGIWILPSIYFPNWLTWKDHSYNKKNGGPLKFYWETFAPDIMPLIGARIERIISTFDKYNIFAWELASEVQRKANWWINECINTARNHTDRMLSVSITGPKTGSSEWAQWNSDRLSYVSFHPYGKKRGDICLDYGKVAGGNASEIFTNRISNVSKLMQTVRSKMLIEKPIIDSETPATPLNFLTKLFTNHRIALTSTRKLEENFYHVNKAYRMAGAAGGGITWGSGPNFVDGYQQAITPKMEIYQHMLYEDKMFELDESGEYETL